jgi:alpha-glucosidase
MPSIKTLLRISAIKLRRIIAEERYSWQRDRLEARYRDRSIASVPSTHLVAPTMSQAGCVDIRVMELLSLRSFQLSYFFPLMQTYASNENLPRIPWGDGAQVLAIARDFLTIRSALMPYLYTLAWESQLIGSPLVRPLCWDAAEREDLWEVEDTFLLGDALLIAPIVHPEQPERLIHLPPGNWYDFWSNNMWAEQPQLSLPVTLDRLPILVKSGCILPLEAAGCLNLHCYPDLAGNCTGELYSDALNGDLLERIDRFELIHDRGKWHLDWDGAGDYPFPYDRVRVVIYGIDLQTVRANDRPIDFEDNILTIEPFQSLVFTGSLHQLSNRE